MSKKEERAGVTYATDQIEGDYFMSWVRDQMYEAGQMDPSQVLPLKTKADAKVIARNMFQQLEWDVKRDLNESPDFFKGFSEYLDRPDVIDWLADEVLSINEELHSNGTEEAKRKRHPEMTGGVFEFAELLKSLVDTQGRDLFIRTEHRLGGPTNYYKSVYINFVNLPKEIVARKAGGGAEAENNRMSFWVEGFDGADPHAPPPTGKVQVEMANSTLPREYRLRKKTGPPGAIAHYLADFLNKVVREVPPKYTHTRNTQEAHRQTREARSREAPRRGAKRYRPHKTWRLRVVDRVVPAAGGHRVEFQDGFSIHVHGGHGRGDLLYAMKPVDMRHERREPGPEARKEYQYAALLAVLDDRKATFVVDRDGDVRAELR